MILGIQHSFTGYDHLLFLIGLLVTGLSARASAKVITSFTLAHSLTLALSATGRIQLSPRFVDPLIAVSIIYVGVENIMRREPRGRELLTFGLASYTGWDLPPRWGGPALGRSTGAGGPRWVPSTLAWGMGRFPSRPLHCRWIWKLGH